MLKCLKQQTFEILSLLECYSRSTTLKDSFISYISSKNGWQRCRQELHKYLCALHLSVMICSGSLGRPLKCVLDLPVLRIIWNERIRPFKPISSISNTFFLVFNYQENSFISTFSECINIYFFVNSKERKNMQFYFWRGCNQLCQGMTKFV